MDPTDAAVPPPASRHAAEGMKVPGVPARRPGGLRIAARSGLRALLAAGFGLTLTLMAGTACAAPVQTAVGGTLPPACPSAEPDTLVIAAASGSVTLLLGGLLILLVLEIRRRAEHASKLESERAMLAAEMRHGMKVQERLRVSEARLRDFAMMASDWFWEQDAELRFTAIGTETPLLLPGDQSHIGRRRWEMNDTSQAQEHWDKHKQDLENRKPFRDFRYSRMGPDGRMRHVSISGVPVFDDDGTFRGYRGTGHDITDKVTAEVELRAAKERAETAETLLRDAVDSISEGFVIYDRDDRLVLCNQAYRTLYPASDPLLVPGARFEDIVRGDLYRGDYPRLKGHEEDYLAERIRQHHAASGELEQLVSTGRWVLVTERRMRDGGIAGLRIDITRLKQTQIALRDSERRVRDYAETSSDWFWEQDAELRFTWIGDQCPTLTGDAAVYRGKRRWDFPSSRETPDEKWRRHRSVLESHQGFRDFRYALRDDRAILRHVSVSGNPVFDTDGNFLGYRGTGREVTAQMAAEAELRAAKDRAQQAESLLRDAVESMSEGFVIFDRDDRLVMCNEPYRKLYESRDDLLVPGMPFEEMLRRVLQHGSHPDADERDAGWLAQRLRHHDEAQGAMEEHLPGDRWVLITDRRMASGGIAGLRINVTALKHAQAALRESEVRLDRAQQIAGVGSWELDLATGRYIWSKELYRIRGLSPDSFQPDFDNVAVYVHPDDYPFVRPWLADLRQGIERDPIDVRIVRPDGNVRTLHVEGRPVAESDGTIRRLSGTMQDITETRLMQRQLAQAQKMDAIGKLTGGMAHDFNNVLGVVIGNLELLGRVVADNALARELLAEALEGAHRGAELTRRLLAFARRQPLHPQPTQVNALVEGLVRLLSRILGENIELRLRLGSALPPILVDPAQLESALTNLVTNARDAMPHGGRLDVATRTAQLDAAYNALHPEVLPGDYVLIEVSDTGTGIPNELLGRIFEPFFTTKEPGRGSGLGLAMVFGFMKQSGGHVSVYTEEGRGTTFRLYLPPSYGRHAVADVGTDVVPMPEGSETVLLVEDNAPLRRATAQQLAVLGYAVHEAENAASALEILRGTQPVDLLFSDVVMPGSMDGIALVRLATELRPGIRVLLASGFPDARSADDRTWASGLPLLGKPVRMEELARVVRDLLDNPVLTYVNA